MLEPPLTFNWLRGTTASLLELMEHDEIVDPVHKLGLGSGGCLSLQ